MVKEKDSEIRHMIDPPLGDLPTFRDSIATVDEEGKRVWIYPKKPSGRFHGWRIVVTVVLLALMFGLPLIELNGQPFILLNFLERRFIIFGASFWPQDFFLLAVVMITFFVFVILFTAAFGRIWCGWMCPQTLFMEMVFRKIEYWIEGDAAAQRRLDQSTWTTGKILKKSSKQFIFALISLLISATVVAYIIGVDATFARLASPGDNLATSASVVVFASIFYGVFAKFREQACIAVCPYGRLQGVLLSKDTIVIAYDWLRGEPRGHLKKSGPTSTLGDCIDCRLCVQVCPTGIDIRNGTQLECVNCTACIDACDHVMEKIHKPKGLIRFASYNSIQNGIARIVNARFIGYSIVLLALIGILGFTILTRSDVETTILKVPGTLYQRDNEFISNLYNIEFVNKTFDEMELALLAESPQGARVELAGGKSLVVKPEGFMKTVCFIKIPEREITNARTVVRVGVYSSGRKIETLTFKFIGPVAKAADLKRQSIFKKN